MGIFYSFFDLIGFSVCHQLYQRSLDYGQTVLPICARDTGIYIGFLVSFIFLTVINRKHEHGFPPVYVWIYGALAIISMAVDGLTSYSGLRTTTNEIRLLTGLLAGSTLPFILVPVFNYQVWRKSSGDRIVKTFLQFAIFLAMIALIFLGFQLRPAFLSFPASFLSIAAILLVFVYINTILVTIIPIWTQRVDTWRDLIVPVAIAVVLSVIELAASYWLHAYMLSRITG